MSSLLDQRPEPLSDSGGARTGTPVAAPAVSDNWAAPAPSPRIPFEAQLRPAQRWTPVTWLLIVANLALFGAMAAEHQQWFHFNPHVLLTWGGGLLPRVFGPEWWRAGSYMFVHASLAHLAGNLLFLVLVGPFLERLLGPWRFALVYLFAGVGGGLLVMGAVPQGVMVGASAAIFGLYGAVLGCCLRAPCSAPWRAVMQQAGWLLLFIAVSLAADWLEVRDQPMVHLGGFAFGLVGGLLCGRQLRPGATRWPVWCGIGMTAFMAGLIGVTAWQVHRSAAQALSFYARYAVARDGERELRSRFDESYRQWTAGKISSAEWRQTLEQTLIPGLQTLRDLGGLHLTGKLTRIERHPFTMRDFWQAVAMIRRKEPIDKEPPTLERCGQLYGLLSKMRLDTWRTLSTDLATNHAAVWRTLLDERELDLLDAGLDEMVNETNTLHRWLRPGKRRPLDETDENERTPPPDPAKYGQEKDAQQFAEWQMQQGIRFYTAGNLEGRFVGQSIDPRATETVFDPEAGFWYVSGKLANHSKNHPLYWEMVVVYMPPSDKYYYVRAEWEDAHGEHAIDKSHHLVR
ncbi:MAG TPA: rhomboid family intramembrane serine protease [Gemmataceae bacterium]|nr:rhomboid family intramembrane serine protease [Gemmataceae bacterium]